MKLSDKPPVVARRILVYGPPKSGKTELVGKLAKYFHLLWCDLENGYTTLLKLPKDLQDKIELVSIPDSRVYPIAVETMLKIIKGDKVDVCEKHGKVNCLLCKKDNLPVTTVHLNALDNNTVVVVDSLTQFSNSCIANITKGQPEDYKLQLDDWGNLKYLIDKFLSQVQAANYSIVCITHEEEVEMEDGKKRIVPVSGSSKSSRNTAKYFDDVVYCEVKNRKHTFGSSTTYGTQTVTGSRAGIALETSAEPDLYDLFVGARAGVTQATTKVAEATAALKSIIPTTPTTK